MSELTDTARQNATLGMLGAPALLIALADHIEELEAALRDVMGHCARAHACDHFSIDYAKKILDE